MAELCVESKCSHSGIHGAMYSDLQKLSETELSQCINITSGLTVKECGSHMSHPRLMTKVMPSYMCYIAQQQGPSEW